MIKKATHSGSCQICGRGQRLPGGVLAKHGYTTQWGFFSGTCWGSGELPFEQSKDLLAEAIRRATVSRDEARAESAKWKSGEQLPDGKAWKRVYNDRISEYVWEQVVVSHETINTQGYIYESFSYQDKTTYGGNERFKKVTLRTGEGLTLDQVRKEMNHVYAEQVFDTRASQLTSYIQWQQERLANWAPKELTPVTAEVEAVNTRKAERKAKSDHKYQIVLAKRAYEQELSIKNRILLTVERGAGRTAAWEELYYYSPATKYAKGLRTRWEKLDDGREKRELEQHITKAIGFAEQVETLKNKKD